MPPGYTHTQTATTTTTYQPPTAPAQGQITPYPYPHPYQQKPSKGTRSATSAPSPLGVDTYSFAYFRVEVIPRAVRRTTEYVSAGSVRARSRRRRGDREADGAVESPDAECRGSLSGGGERPRSSSFPPPVQVGHEEERERDGRTRNGIELQENYTRGQRGQRSAESDSEGLSGEVGVWSHMRMELATHWPGLEVA